MLRNGLWKLREFAFELRGLGSRAHSVFGTPDGRWTMVATSFTALVAFTTTWLALDAMPASTAVAYEPAQQTVAQPYTLLQRLAGFGAVPGIAHEDPNRLYRQAGLISPGLTGPLDHVAAKPSVETKTLKAGSGDTIMGMLQDAGVSNQDAAAVVDAIKPLYSPRSLHSGQTFQATFGASKTAANIPVVNEPLPSQSDDADDSDTSAARRLLSLSFSPSVDHQIMVQLTAPDGYFAQDVQRKLEAHYQHAGATIDSSLYLAAMQAGIPANVVVEMIHMFSYEVDFQRDVHPGDQFEVFFNHFYTADGAPAKAGDILAASMTLSGKKHLLYRYEQADGVEYFNAQGQSAKSMLMKTPVDGARISSGFGERFHPILGYTRMHKGIDFAVPTGTPVMAAGSGTVTFVGPAGEYGNFVVINHGNGYATAYGHLSRFAQGLRPGTRVHQGEVVAYSGMTGLATGPHLHYEIRINNAPVNPASVKVASGRKLGGPELTAFISERARIDTLVTSLPVQSRLAQATGLRESNNQ